MRTSRARALAMGGLVGILGQLVIGCEHTVDVEAYLDDELRPMFAGVRVLRGAGSTGRDRLELVASDRLIDCANLGDGRLVLKLALYDWRSGSHPVDLEVATSDAGPPRLRWAIGSPQSTYSQMLPLGFGLLALPLRQETAPTRRGERARFELPAILVATLPPVDPSSCCAQRDVDFTTELCGAQCPMPIRIERLVSALDVELCDDIDLSTIERQR